MSTIPANGLRVIPLGGLGDIGRNMMIFETATDLVVVDAGLMFPTAEMLGVDYIIPEVSYLHERKEKIRAYLITHGHEDHIGALRYVLRDLPAPIYATRLTQGLISLKLREGKLRDLEQTTIATGTTYDFGSIQAEFFPVTHSIPDSVGIALHTPAGLVVHSGDFKIDHTPVMSAPIDLRRLAALGDEGVRLLCSDSTYADTPGHTPSEKVVGGALEQIMLSAPGRVMIATFASQIARVQQIIDGAEATGRTMFVTGRSMVQNVRMAQDLGYIQCEPDTIRNISEHKHLPDEDVVIVCTGAQGEPMAALSRMATGDYRDVELKSGDTVIFSSSPIPGNESAVNRTINHLYRAGVDVRYTGGGDKQVHVHGHASQEELKTVLALTHPRDFLPIHGEYRHLVLHSQLAQGAGVDPDRCHVLLDGSVLELTPDETTLGDEVPASYVYVDGMSVGDVDHTVLRDRRHLASDGVVVVVVTVDHRSGQLAGQVDVVSRGFVGIDESPALGRRAAETLQEALAEHEHPMERHVLHDLVRQQISRFLYTETRQRPMVVPVAVEV